MKKISILCLLLGLTTMCVFADRRPAKKLTNLRFELSQAEIAELQQRRAPAAYFANPDTVELTDDLYGIDYVQADYYVTGEPAQGYFTFAIMNYDDEYPEIHLDVNAPSKTQIQGEKTVNLELSYLDLDDHTRLTLSKAFFWLKYTGKDVDFGYYMYDILAVVWASDGKIYRFEKNLAVEAYDGDDSIELEDAVDSSVIEPELPDDTPTAIENTSALNSAKKRFVNGQLIIEKNGRTFNAQGAEVK
jgi:hypothetical protein